MRRTNRGDPGSEVPEPADQPRHRSCEEARRSQQRRPAALLSAVCTRYRRARTSTGAGAVAPRGPRCDDGGTQRETQGRGRRYQRDGIDLALRTWLETKSIARLFASGTDASVAAFDRAQSGPARSSATDRPVSVTAEPRSYLQGERARRAGPGLAGRARLRPVRSRARDPRTPDRPPRPTSTTVLSSRR